jgi:hypothetical protein
VGEGLQERNAPALHSLSTKRAYKRIVSERSLPSITYSLLPPFLTRTPRGFVGLIDWIPDYHNLSKEQLLRRWIGVRFGMYAPCPPNSMGAFQFVLLTLPNLHGTSSTNGGAAPSSENPGRRKRPTDKGFNPIPSLRARLGLE